MKINVVFPDEILEISEKLHAKGFLAYVVGGCVRDLLMKRIGGPKDWDVATDATPEEIQNIFPDSVYENTFGTVGIKTESEHEKLKVVEVTTFRKESPYSDHRHPDEVVFAKTIEEDLGRRDFTVNAIAADIETLDIVDPYNGMQDIEKRIIRAVGDPFLRFGEDALRMMRAIRFWCQLSDVSGQEWLIDKKTQDAVVEESHTIQMISAERIRDEFIKIIMSNHGNDGIEMLRSSGMLKYFLPELIEGIGVGQNKHHIYTVWEHNVRAYAYSMYKGYSLEIRLASLFHDIGKPRTKGGDGPDSTFYRHEMVGASMTKKVMERLKFSKKISDHVVHLVRFHLFYYNVGDVTEAGVRRFLKRVGPENVDDLLKVREADRIGSGVPKAFPYKLRHLLFMIEKVKKDPIDSRMIAINGNEIMEHLSLVPCPRVGWIMSVLLEEVIEDPSLNDKKILLKRAEELHACDDRTLMEMQKKAKEKKQEFEEGIEKEMKRKHKVG